MNRSRAAFVFLALLALTACERGARTDFSGEAALGYAREQLAFGPRVPGTPAHVRAGDWIVARMRERADTVIEQRWTHVTAQGDTLPLRNILARFRPSAAERVLYLTHWDTRPIADEERDPARRSQPIAGANDGASGVGLFVALGDVLKKTPPSVGVDLLFVDGEDYGTFDPSGATYGTDVLLGSIYFAQHLPSPDYKPLYGVLFDMIGDANLDIYQEWVSVQSAPEVVAKVWQTARDLKYNPSPFIPRTGQLVTDDHVPLLKAGLHVIDVIDINYPYHHTLEDTIDKISAKSLQQVGDVATALVTER
ncbi:MAG TPA: M28 family peptidase [Gemmatimonadaceae bacterium]|nr:M28 family peptidase [Gemmatimonadaceae bacterium]